VVLYLINQPSEEVLGTINQLARLFRFQKREDDFGILWSPTEDWKFNHPSHIMGISYRQIKSQLVLQTQPEYSHHNDYVISSLLDLLDSETKRKNRED